MMDAPGRYVQLRIHPILNSRTYTGSVEFVMPRLVTTCVQTIGFLRGTGASRRSRSPVRFRSRIMHESIPPSKLETSRPFRKKCIRRIGSGEYVAQQPFSSSQRGRDCLSQKSRVNQGSDRVGGGGGRDLKASLFPVILGVRHISWATVLSSCCCMSDCTATLHSALLSESRPPLQPRAPKIEPAPGPPAGASPEHG